MRTALILIFALALLLPLAAAALLLQPAPLVAERLEATPEKVVATRDLVARVRRVTERPDGRGEVRVTPAEANAALSLIARIAPMIRATADLTPEGPRLRASAPALRGTPFAWLNLEVTAAPSDAGPRLHAVRLGPLDLPPETALRAGALAANLILGGGAGDRLLAGVQSLRVENGAVVAALSLTGDERSSLTARVAGAVRGGALPGPDVIAAHYFALREAAETGRLPDRGPFHPHLRFVAETAAARAAPGGEADEITAGLFALAMFCGAADFRLGFGSLIDGVIASDPRTWTRSCDAVTLGERIDLRRHFVTAAAIKAASTRDVSFRVGEFKEMSDKIKAGGFDFTDVAANNSGIRFAQTFMAAPRADWPRLIARIGSEADVLIPLDGIPGLLPRPDFDARFGQVDSPAYLAQIAEIEARIDRLPLHAPLDPS